MGAGRGMELGRTLRVELRWMRGENGLGSAKFGDGERLGVCGLAEMLAKE